MNLSVKNSVTAPVVSLVPSNFNQALAVPGTIVLDNVLKRVCSIAMLESISFKREKFIQDWSLKLVK
jgi:hypothetical protein